MRTDNSHLADMLVAAQRVATHIQGVARVEFLANRTIQAAVEREVSIVGEAASRLSTEFREAHPELPWKRLIQLRNFYVHAYERLDPNEVWITATRFIPKLERQVSALLPAQDPRAGAAPEADE